MDLQLDAAVNYNKGGNGGDLREGQTRDLETGLCPVGKMLSGTKHFRNLPLQQVSE